jgi:hypothetical protein
MICHHAPTSLARLQSDGASPVQIAKAEYVSFVMLMVKQLRSVADWIESHPDYPLADHHVRRSWHMKVRHFRKLITRVHKMGGKYTSDRVQLVQGGLVNPR